MRTAGICSNKRQDYNSFWTLEYDVYEIKIGLIFKANMRFNKENAKANTYVHRNNMNNIIRCVIKAYYLYNI